MGKATGLAPPEQIVSMKLEVHTLQSISETLSLTFSNVRDIWKNYIQLGSIGLLTHYDNYGQKMGDKFELIYRASIWLKHLHPLWGSPRVDAGLKSRYRDKTPAIRTLNRWYEVEQLVKPHSKTNQVHIGSAKAVHNIWQVDVKEHLMLLDGQEACYLTIVDEKRGAWLTSLIFLYGHICQVSIENMRDKLIEVFLRWGKCGAMRMDNREPLGSPKKNTTSALPLWLIANDVDMIFNKLYCPQSNAKKERMQDFSARWAEILQAQNLTDLQSRLDKESILGSMLNTVGN